MVMEILPEDVRPHPARRGAEGATAIAFVSNGK